MRKSALGVVAAVVVSATVFGGASAFAASPPTGTPVTVSVDSARGSQVGNGFAGFSYEKNEVGADLFDTSNTNLVNLFRLLGPNVIRIGGNQVDRVNWNAAGAGGNILEVAPSDVTKLAGFLRATHWKVIYGIDLKLNTSANAASEAQFAAQALGNSLQAFEIGNEPDFYDTQAQYEAAFSQYVGAIKAVAPDVTFDGPGQAKGTQWDTTFGLDQKANSLTILSDHTYIDSAANANIPEMMASNAPGGKLQKTEAAMQKAQQASGIGTWRMTETNSFFNGGATGVSDTAAASLWSLDYMSGIAAHGGVGINFHGGGTSKYTPITFSGNTVTGVQGVYYGELLWVMAGTGAYHSASVNGSPDVTSWGIGRNVFVNNKGATPVTATITLPSFALIAAAFTMTAPSLGSTAITIGGAAVSASGAFHPVPHVMPVFGTKVTVTVPAGSAVLVDTL
ncbi:MAG TPA: glycosyl hydrolase family 79 C-terminal domain-containing protein [Pseudonocardiaceae bacterium]